MNPILTANIITCVCSFLGFIYGMVKFFQSRKAVYAQMITFATGCMAFGRLYQVIRILTMGEINNEFQLGILGVIGTLLFLFSANFGLMDSLADDGSKKYLKYRLIPLAAPAVIIAAFVLFFLLADVSTLFVIIAGFICLVAAMASYYNLKHIIFPDVDFGVIKCLKSYNALALAFEFLCVAELVANIKGSEIALLITGALMGIVMLLITPTVERGIKKWTT